MSERAIVHQALHGYRDGHDLISSSCDLPRSARRQMLILSDLSGDNVAPGFEEYTTAYPVDGTEYYAIARTWYANEMARPGCVWTHSLLLSRSLIETALGFGRLLGMFRRPEAKGAEYDRPLRLTDALSLIHVDGSMVGLGAELLHEFYGAEARSVLVAAESGRSYTALLFGILAQAPGPLRATLCLCTGSLEFRSWDGRPFDLQVVPRGRWRRIARSVGARKVAVFEEGRASADGTDRVPSWALMLGNELANPNERLRTTLLRLCYGAPPTRGACGAIIRTLHSIEGKTPDELEIGRILDEIASEFPTGAAIPLKALLLGPDNDAGPLFPIEEEVRLRAILSSSHSAAFPFESFDVRERVRRSITPGPGWNPSLLRWLSSGDALNSEALALRRGLFAQFDAEGLVELFEESRDLLSLVLSVLPSLILQPGVWVQHREFQQACLECVGTLSDVELGQVIDAIVASPRFVLGKELLAGIGPGATSRLLTSLNSALLQGRDVEVWRWRDALEQGRVAARTWLAQLEAPLAGRLLSIIAALGIDGADALRCVRARSAIRGIYAERRLERSPYREPDVAALTLSVGLEDPTRHGAVLTSLVFDRVHAGLMGNQVSWAAWKYVEPNLPRGGLFGFLDWDNAEKIRRGLVDRYLRFRTWPRSMLRRTLKDRDSRARVVQYCRTIAGGPELLADAGLTSERSRS